MARGKSYIDFEKYTFEKMDVFAGNLTRSSWHHDIQLLDELTQATDRYLKKIIDLEMLDLICEKDDDDEEKTVSNSPTEAVDKKEEANAAYSWIMAGAGGRGKFRRL